MKRDRKPKMWKTAPMAMAGLLIVTLCAGCCKKQTCPPVPTPTQLLKPGGRMGPGGPGQVVVVRHQQEAATPAEVARYVQVARAMYMVQELMDWHARTRGERSVTAMTYAGRKGWISWTFWQGFRSRLINIRQFRFWEDMAM